MEDKNDRRGKQHGTDIERRKGGDRRKKDPDMSQGTVPLERKADWDAIDDELNKDKK